MEIKNVLRHVSAIAIIIMSFIGLFLHINFFWKIWLFLMAIYAFYVLLYTTKQEHKGLTYFRIALYLYAIILFFYVSKIISGVCIIFLAKEIWDLYKKKEIILSPKNSN